MSGLRQRALAYGAVAFVGYSGLLWCWGSWVAHSDAKAAQYAKAETCGDTKFAYQSLTTGRIVCLAGSGRAKR